MNKQKILLVGIVFLLFLCFLKEGFTEPVYIVKRDTYGAYTKDGIAKLLNIILAKDTTTLSKLVIEKTIFSVEKGTKVFIEERLLLDGFVRVSPEGKTESVWLLEFDLSQEVESNDKRSFENVSGYIIEGISYDKSNPIVMIDGKGYFVNDSIIEAKIIEILPDRIKMRQEEEIREFKIGDRINFFKDVISGGQSE